MGSGASLLSDSVQRHLTDEFNRVKKPNRNYLVLSDLRQLEPLRDIPINFTHIGTLSMMDTKMDGRVSYQELLDFAVVCSRRQKLYQAHEFQSQLQGYFTFCMYASVSREGGVDKFVKWFTRLFSEGVEFHTFNAYPGVGFLNRDAAHLLHEVLGIEQVYSIDTQGFFDLLQRVGEEKGLLNLSDEEMDDYVPVEVVHVFSRAFIEGFIKLMRDLGLSPVRPP